MKIYVDQERQDNFSRKHENTRKSMEFLTLWNNFWSLTVFYFTCRTKFTFIEINIFFCRFLHVVGDGITVAHTETGPSGTVAHVAHPTPRGHGSLPRCWLSKACITACLR